MSCLQNFPISSASPLSRTKWSYSRRGSLSRLEINRSNLRVPYYLHVIAAMNASSGSTQSSEKGGVNVQEEKSEVYSNNMTEAMGTVLTYRHELGMNYNFIRPDLIVGSCLQIPSDVGKLIKIGVRTIFCLQQNSDLEYPDWFCIIESLSMRWKYFGVDIQTIEDYAKKCENIEHVRAEIREEKRRYSLVHKTN